MTLLPNQKADNLNAYEAPEEEAPTWSEIEDQAAEEIDAAIKFVKNNIIEKRTSNWDCYYGKPLGNEIAGKSKYVSRDLLETIEWILPSLINLFTGADSKVKLKIFNEQVNQQISPTQLGKLLIDKIYKDLSMDEYKGLFLVFYTWFKDALVSGSAFTQLYWEIDTVLDKIHQAIPNTEMNRLSQTKEVTIEQIRPSVTTGQSMVDATIERISKNTLVVDNIPHWEFIFEEYAQTMNDDAGKGFVTIVSIDYLRRINEAYSKPNEPFFQNLELVSQIGSNDTYDDVYGLGDEKKIYFDYAVLNSFTGQNKKGPKKRVQLTKWVTRLDINGDGFLEDILVWRANGVMIRWEINESHFIPFCQLSPIIDCYKFQGIAYADLLVELQDLKTALTRKMLDNFDLQNSGRWFIKPNTQIDLKRFLENVPGDVYRIDPERIKNMAPQGFDTSQLALLEYVETVKENRTGSTRYNQGTDANTLNQTAHGIQTIMSASMKRIELIGLLFAESGIKDLYRKAALLMQQNLEEPFQATINGETVTISPEMIQGRIEVSVEMGLENQVGQRESQKLLQMSAVLMDLNSKFPGLVPPDKAHNIAVKYITCLGYEADQYLSSIKEFMEAEQNSSKQQQALQQMQIQMQQLKLQLEKEAVDVKKLAAFGKIEEAQKKLIASLLLAEHKTKEATQLASKEQRVDIFKTLFKEMAQGGA